jgi:hypothetical protein
MENPAGDGNTPVEQSETIDLTKDSGAVQTKATVLLTANTDDEIKYEIVDNPDGLFRINANGVISFKGNTNYEATNIGLETENAGMLGEKKYFYVVVRAYESWIERLKRRLSVAISTA